MHHFQDARQQRRSFQRTHSLALQQICQRIHLAGQFTQRIMCIRAARAKGVIALAQRCNHVCERLQLPHKYVDQCSRHQS